LLCKAKYRELPKDLLTHNLSLSLDFFIPFSLSAEEIAFSPIHTMSFKKPQD
jgi:hypothetical protein